MTSNVGTEYINLKKAKYNRDMRAKSAGGFTPAIRSGASRKTSVQKPYAGAVPENRVYAGSSVHKVSVSAPMGGTSAGELWGGISAEIGRAIAEKRRAAAREKASETKYVKKSVKAARPFPVSVIGYTVVFAAIAMFLVLGNSKINEATLRADSLKSAVAAEAERGEMLASALNQRKDAGYIEDYAENVLGMVKSTDVAKRYVSISGEDKIVVNGEAVPHGADAALSA